VLQLPGPAQNDLLIHFCGRGAHRNTDDVPPQILNGTPQDRLAGIIREGMIRGFVQHNGGFEAVCFSEVDRDFAHFRWLINSRGFAPWGLAFTRERIVKRGGGPVFSARNDLHDSVNNLAAAELAVTGGTTSADYLRTQMTRFEPFDPKKPSDWLWEQEWRCAVPGGEFALGSKSIEAIIVGDPDWWPRDPDTNEPPTLWVNARKLYWDGETLQEHKRPGEV
jgi:hypothetical protein